MEEPVDQILGRAAEIYRGDLAFAAKHASASRQWTRRTTDPAIPGRIAVHLRHGRIAERPCRPGPTPACREPGDHPRLTVDQARHLGAPPPRPSQPVFAEALAQPPLGDLHP